MIRCTINGRVLTLDVHPMTRALDVLREDCELTGTKEGCGEGECGACTIHLDGIPVNACLIPAAHLDGATVTTIEGLAGDGVLHPLQEAFVMEGGAQCGICTPGMIMAALTLPPRPSLDDVKRALAGNLCRCTGYEAIYRAVERGGGTGDTGGAGAAGGGAGGAGGAGAAGGTGAAGAAGGAGAAAGVRGA